jgi:hypothetical protein
LANEDTNSDFLDNIEYINQNEHLKRKFYFAPSPSKKAQDFSTQKPAQN